MPRKNQIQHAHAGLAKVKLVNPESAQEKASSTAATRIFFPAAATLSPARRIAGTDSRLVNFLPQLRQNTMPIRALPVAAAIGGGGVALISLSLRPLWTLRERFYVAC